MFGTMIDYTALTGDNSYVEPITQALLHQASDTRDFMPPNQTRTLGNDDQGFWAMAAMSAAENRFPDPPPDQAQWLALAQAAFNQWASRWDEETCGGGLRWQIFTFNTGFTYKNSISNGCFFNVASRLARFTGNQTYADWAAKIWAWEEQAGLITPEFDVYDGVGVVNSTVCPDTDTIQWSYNHGIFLAGAATMYSVTNGSDVWQRRVSGLLESTVKLFYKDNILYEQFCEDREFCNQDQQSFKGYLTRWLASTTQLAPFTFDRIYPLLQSSAAAAARACSGAPASGFAGIPGTACGFKWTTGAFDGLIGVSEQMNALSAVMYTLVDKVSAPATADSGGTSKGDAGAGLNLDPMFPQLSPITLRDRVAAGFVTTAIALGVVGGSAFVMF